MEVLIAGGGIAGLAAAIAMSKAGHDVEVIERASELREIGAALSLWPNALAALDHLGLSEQIAANSLEAPTGSILSTRGKPLARFEAEAMRGALGGLPVVTLRADLQTILLRACGDLEIEVRLGETVRSARLDRGRVVVTTTGESSYDALVGADGINSTVRATVIAQDDPRACDRVAWRAVVSNIDGVIDKAWLTVGVALQFIASPAPRGLAYWAADTPAHVTKDEPIDPMAVLHRLFGSWHAPIPAIISATPPDDVIITEILDRRPPDALRRGPIVLVGDAAHAMTPDLGQGACQGLEDAAILFACANGSNDPGDIFREFEARRLGHVRRIVRDSRALGKLATTRRSLAAQVRDALVRVIPEGMNNRRLASYASVAAFRSQLDTR